MKCPWWAKIIKKPGSERLYIKMSYHGRYIEKSTQLVDNPENRELVQEKVDTVNEDLAKGQFVFSELFPDASHEELRFFAEKEKRTFVQRPDCLTFGEAYRVWKECRFHTILSDSQREDYKKAINPHILPFFGQLTFDEIDIEKIKDFFSTRYLHGNPDNGLVSKKRMLNIKIPLVDIWDFAVRRWNLDLKSPFKGEEINSHINDITTKMTIPLTITSVTDKSLLERMLEREEEKLKKGQREVILISDYFKILKECDPFYVEMIELMLLTGLSASEMAGLHIESRQQGFLRVQWSVIGNVVKDYQKAKERTRDIPLTAAINRVLDRAMEKKAPDTIFIFTTKTGLPLSNQSIRKSWYRACRKAEQKEICPYSLRHCFIAYCELMKIDKPRIIGLVGHCDKSMIDTVYGKYKNGTEKEIELIKEYFGEDFWGK